MRNNLNHLNDLLSKGEEYFGSGSTNSAPFNQFAKDFKKAFAAELKSMNATISTFSKGHFYISGFLLKEDKFYYFCINDVRGGPSPQMLFRTAHNTKDYSGGHNQYVRIFDGMAEKMKL
ncbi:MAG: hypothetical protein ACJ77K_19190 [Bacteroidia bacterium]